MGEAGIKASATLKKEVGAGVIRFDVWVGEK
jgi:hypothetical protein